jgi:hypothetical protein
MFPAYFGAVESGLTGGVAWRCRNLRLRQHRIAPPDPVRTPTTAEPGSTSSLQAHWGSNAYKSQKLFSRQYSTTPLMAAFSA